MNLNPPIRQSNVPNIPVVKIAAVVLVLFGAMWLPSNLFEHLDAQHLMVIQSPVSGNLALHITPGVKWQGFGKVTKYLRRDQYSFDVTNKTVIKARFNDGGHGDISGGVAWEMPTDREHLLILHAKYGDQDTIENQLVKTVVEKAVYMTGPLMSSKESSAERRNDMIGYIEDQIQRGIYQTHTEQNKEPDPMTGQMKTISIVKLVLDSKGLPVRQESSPLSDFGIRVFNLSINGINYDATVEAQIQEQQKAMMQVQTAMANAKRAEQDAITAEKNGQAAAATAKWTQEAIKAQKVTEAEQLLAVATLNRQVQEQDKQANILQGQGEAEKRRLIMQADGALAVKLQTWLNAQEMWATAFGNFKGTLVPQVVTGGNNGGQGQNAALDFMNLMGIKAAKDLALDLQPKQ